ncbi:MAG: hypothetical protein K9M08_15360 [Pirellula sp.]|nr:hypothetical protein [Pirellula sp.]
MHKIHLRTLIFCIIACKTSCILLADETRPVIRRLDDSILHEMDSEYSRGADNVIPGTFTASIATPIVPATEGYRLDGVRGKELPAGPKQGRYCENGFERSGLPFCLGRFAKPSISSSHMIGYVGGGTAFGGERRTANDGTFGMDYSGSWFARKTWLKWSHGERYQGGHGRYETDGPRVLPE